jgi:hypothetical protein
MIKDYQGCKNHTNCIDWNCQHCLDEIKKQQNQDENNNHSDSEEIEYIVNNEEIEG